jgi:PAS domain S-box-containing protein
MQLARVSPVVVPYAAFRDPGRRLPRLALAAASTAIAYWAGAKLGFQLERGPEPVALLWPPNALLLAALLVVPTRYWWVILLGALPAHLFVELGSGVPLRMVLSWYVSNAFEALLGAALVRRFNGPGRRLDSVRALGVFIVCASFFATFASSFLDAAFVTWNDWGSADYWSVWRVRFFSNVLGTQTIVPTILALDARAWRAVRSATLAREIEAVALALALIVVCGATFTAPPEIWRVGPAMLYAPLPLLLWAAVRFGICGVNLALLGVTVTAIWGVVRGSGPFVTLAPDGNAFSVQIFLFLIAVPMSMLATVIEERRQAEAAAREGTRLLALSIGGARIGVWTSDFESGFVRAVGDAGALMGMLSTDGEFPCSEWMERIHPEDRAEVEERYRLASLPTAPRDEQGDTPIKESIFRFQEPTGSVRWILSRATVLRRPDGSAHRATGVNVDITERRRIDLSLAEGNERMELAAATAKIGFWSIALGSGDLWVSSHCYALLGMEEGTTEARDAVEALVRATASREDANDVLATVGSDGMREYELLISAADGVERWIAASARRIRGPDGDTLHVIGMIRDITEQRRAERAVRQQQAELTHLSRISLVGELAAAIVHEVGQPIGAVTLNAQAAERLLERPDVSHETLREIVQEILRDNQRAVVEIKQLRDLVRRAEFARERLDMRQVVREALVITRRELTNDSIQVGLQLADDVPPVMGNKAQLQQVLLNLILNARDAMLDMPPPLRELQVTVEHGERDTVHVALADAGSGISSERVDEMFEPFVTSKRHGLGLGLAISRSIVVEHGGSLRAERGEIGTILHLTLPAAESPADA